MMNLSLCEWTNEKYINFITYLKSFADSKYRDFHSSLVPTAEKDTFIGIRMPQLRFLAKEIAKGNPRDFLKTPSHYYEERMLKGIVIGLIKPESFDDFTSLCDSFVVNVDNWAICDGFCASLKQTKRYKSEFFEHIQKYLDSGDDWQIRVALVIMLDYYLDDEYIDRVLKRCDSVKCKAYYVSMAQAWLVATAVAKCREKTMKYLHQNSLDDVTFNKAIQKCVESFRIDDETKTYLRTIKR